MLRPITIDRDSALPFYRQIAEQIIEQIRRGLVVKGTRLPATRVLSRQLGIHRKSIVRAYEELGNLEWIESAPGRGTFVAVSFSGATTYPPTGPVIGQNTPRDFAYRLDDGLPDPRLLPLTEMERIRRSILRRAGAYGRLGYADPLGNERLRDALVPYLLKSRGLNADGGRLMTTHGVTNALFLFASAVVRPGDRVIVPELTWESGKKSLTHLGVRVVSARLDERGLDVDHVSALLKEDAGIRAIYVTPHHQYPTTVVMPAGRRLQLLELAREHDLYIFEDDYDYDYHYGGLPISPLASTENGGRIVYAGSFTKALSPAFRLGYLVADPSMIARMSEIRRFSSRMGDPVLEATIADLIRLGILEQVLKRARRTYRSRRDALATLLSERLADRLRFEVPEGGMAIWTKLNGEHNPKQLCERAAENGLLLNEPVRLSGKGVALRLGFASHNEDELAAAVNLLTSCFDHPQAKY